MSNDTLEVSPTDYHAKLKFNRDDIFHPDSYLSKSVLWATHGVSLWAWKRKAPFKANTAMQWGTIIDILTTTPEEADELIVSKSDCPYLSSDGGYRSDKAKEWRDEHLDAGHCIVTTEDYMKAIQHADILLNQHPISSKIFAESKKQVILHCKTKEGVNLKGLADLIPPRDYLCDLKTTADFSIAGFGKTCAKYGYHVQAGLYLIMWNLMHTEKVLDAETGEDTGKTICIDERKRFVHIWQDSATGEVAVTEMSADDILSGQAMARYLLTRLVMAYRYNHFPMLTDDEMPVISRPTWAQMEDEMLLDGQSVTLGKEQA